MDKHFSLYLDLVRLLAAVLVVLSHFSQHGILGDPTTVSLGREAVIVFFVLSGYVIAFTTRDGARSLRQYALARSTRLYSVALPLAMASFAVGGAVTTLTGTDVESGYQLHKPWLYLPLHLLFGGQLWTLAETPPWLAPYWSLCYEAWYYVLFGVAFYARGAWRAGLLALVALLMGYKLLLLLPVWLAGTALQHYLAQPRTPLPLLTARLGWVATLGALAVFKLYGIDAALRALGVALWPFPQLPLGSADRYLADYVVCLLVWLNFLCARDAPLLSLQACARPVRALARYTFTLYLVHALVIGLWLHFYHPVMNRGADAALLAACICLATYACGQVTERRRHWFRACIERLCGLAARPRA